MNRVVRSRRVRHPRGVSLVELMVAMAGVSVVVTTTAMVIHGAMRAQTASRRFFDDERTSVRLARAFRADAHAATGTADPARGAIVTFTLPGGRSIDYRRPEGSDRIERREHAVDGTIVGPREDFQFGVAFAAAATVADDVVRLSLGADDEQGRTASPGAANSRPPALAIEARLGRDLRFATQDGGEGAR